MRNALLLFALVLSLLATPVFGAATIIGDESLVAFPPSAKYNLILNDRPRDNETVDLNAPRISWSYVANPTNSSTDTTPREFLFEVAYESSFTNPVVSVRTKVNAYNFLAPFTNNLFGSNVVFWRATDYNATNGALITVRAANSFLISATATLWDRSLLANTNYMATNFAHPHMGWTSNTLPAMTNWVVTNTAFAQDWLTTTNYAWQAITNTWWTNSNPTARGIQGTNTPIWSSSSPNDMGWDLWGNRVQQVAFTFAMTRQAAMSNVTQRVSDIATFLRQPQMVAQWLSLSQPTTGDSFTFDGLTVVWTNGTPASTNFILIGADLANSCTNLANYFTNLTGKVAFPEVAYDFSQVNFRGVSGSLWTISDSGTWATSSLYTNPPMLYLDSTTWTTTDLFRALWFGYDWLYHDMTVTQRTNCLATLERMAERGFDLGYWDEVNSAKVNWWSNDPLGTYPGGYYVDIGSHMKRGSPHPLNNKYQMLYAAMSARNDGAFSSNYVWQSLNQHISRPDPLSDDGHPNQGRGYSQEDMWSTAIGMMLTDMTLQTFMPAIGWNQNPYWRENIDWQMRANPVGFYEYHEPFGDLGGYGYAMNMVRLKVHGRDWAAFLNDPTIYRQWTNSTAYWGADNNLEPAFKLPLMRTFPVPTSSPTNPTTAKLFPLGGWVMSSTYGHDTKSNWNNGVGIVFQARPTGTTFQHDSMSDLTFQMWAYGVGVTESGYGFVSANSLDESANGSATRSSWTHYGPMINGLRQLGTAYPRSDYYAKIFAYTNNADFTYWAADGTRLFDTNCIRHERHMVFVRKKYLVFLDTFHTVTNSTFSSIFQIPTFATNRVTLIDSTNAQFIYSVSNAANQLASGTTTSNTTVFVKSFTLPSSMTLSNMAGSNSVKNPFTGIDQIASANAQSMGARPNALWWNNATPATNWVNGWVFYPVLPGASNPTITRLDDLTVAITNGAEVDIVSFDTNTAFAATLIVSTLNSSPNDSNTNAPATPTGLSATGGDSTVGVSWNSTSYATSYLLKAGPSGGPYVTLTNTTATSYTYAGTNAVEVCFVVLATNSYGASAASSAVCATPVAGSPPGVPASLTATAGNTLVDLDWANTAGATAYYVQRSLSSGSGFSVVQRVTASDVQNTSLANGTTYYFKVAASNDNGLGTYTSEVSATPAAPAPASSGAKSSARSVIIRRGVLR